MESFFVRYKNHIIMLSLVFVGRQIESFWCTYMTCEALCYQLLMYIYDMRSSLLSAFDVHIWHAKLFVISFWCTYMTCEALCYQLLMYIYDMRSSLLSAFMMSWWKLKPIQPQMLFSHALIQACFSIPPPSYNFKICKAVLPSAHMPK